jgi:uncharacterized protein (TIGR02391 family)
MTVSDLGLRVLRRDDREIYDDLRHIPQPLGRAERPEERIELRVRALSFVPAAEEVLENFVRIVKLIGQRIREGEPDALRIDAVDLTNPLGISPEMAPLIKTLVYGERWMLGSGNLDAWWWEISERAIPIRSATSLDDYLRIEGERNWNVAANRSLMPPNPLVDSIDELTIAQPTSAATPILLGIEDLHPAVAEAVGGLLSGRHYNEAVGAGAMVLRDLLRSRSGRDDLDGAVLVDATLTGRHPPLAIADLSQPRGDQEQAGWHKLAAGWIAAIRNPSAHRRAFADRASAIEAIALMSLLARRIDTAAEQPPEPVSED